MSTIRAHMGPHEGSVQDISRAFPPWDPHLRHVHVTGLRHHLQSKCLETALLQPKKWISTVLISLILYYHISSSVCFFSIKSSVFRKHMGKHMGKHVGKAQVFFTQLPCPRRWSWWTRHAIDAVPLAPSPAVGGTWRGWPGTHGIPSLGVFLVEKPGFFIGNQ